jgi:hypothetical protein
MGNLRNLVLKTSELRYGTRHENICIEMVRLREGSHRTVPFAAFCWRRKKKNTYFLLMSYRASMLAHNLHDCFVFGRGGRGFGYGQRGFGEWATWGNGSLALKNGMGSGRSGRTDISVSPPTVAHNISLYLFIYIYI